jgi:hypothetical protein
MKRTITFLICIAVGIGIGWYFGYTRPTARNQREVLRQAQYLRDHHHEFDSLIADLDKARAVYRKAAKPYFAESASIALAALKRIDSNDVEGARSMLALPVANYYRGHSNDEDTNLLARIVAFAATDTVLSNAIYRK